MSLTNTIQPLQPLRFVYTEEITDLLNNFAKEHYKDDKTKFKKEWNDWIKQEEIKEKLNNEIQRLQKLGLQDDIMDRMVKSVKYYYCKKLQNRLKPSSKPKSQVKNYTTLSSIILSIMDEHIYKFINEHCEEPDDQKQKEKQPEKQKKKAFSPAEAYEHFCNENKSALLQEIIEYRKRVLLEQQVEKILNDDNELKELKDDRLNPEILSEKIKKTYKNRFYIITKEKLKKIEKN
jgi:hypothetical protein